MVAYGVEYWARNIVPPDSNNSIPSLPDPVLTIESKLISNSKIPFGYEYCRNEYEYSL